MPSLDPLDHVKNGRADARLLVGMAALMGALFAACVVAWVYAH